MATQDAFWSPGAKCPIPFLPGRTLLEFDFCLATYIARDKLALCCVIECVKLNFSFFAGEIKGQWPKLTVFPMNYDF